MILHDCSPSKLSFEAFPSNQEVHLMARKSIFVSDLSGEEIADGKGAQVTIRFNDARKGTIILDVTDDEGEAMGATGRAVSVSRPVSVEPKVPAEEPSAQSTLKPPASKARAGMHDTSNCCTSKLKTRAGFRLTVNEICPPCAVTPE